MAEYQVKLLSHAYRDLDEIYGYIVEMLLEPGTAASMLDALENGILSLEFMPYRFPIRRSGVYSQKGYHQMMVKNHAVIYCIDEKQKQVIVVTVRYARSSF